MYALIAIFIIIGAILMVAVVLLQPGKGDLTATFGGFSSQVGAVFGMQRATDLLAKITKWIAVIILILILVTNKFFVHQGGPEQQIKPVTEGAQIPTSNQGVLAPPPVDAQQQPQQQPVQQQPQQQPAQQQQEPPQQQQQPK